MQVERSSIPLTRGWEHFEHGADVGIRGRGPSAAAAFEQAALALTAVVADPERVQPEGAIRIACDAPDLELLFVDWLNCLVFEMSTRRVLFGRFDVSIRGTRLEATAWGEPVALRRHEPRVEIKGATYTAARVDENDGEWVAQCVVDV